MKIWVFSSVESAQQEDERITAAMGLSAPYNAFNYHEDEVNGVYAFADSEIKNYIDMEKVQEVDFITIEEEKI